MSTIRVVVVDDEPLARRRIVRLLADREGFEVAGEFGSGRKAALAIPEIEPDLLFLDVQMPEMGGFEVLESLSRSRPPVVIFVTAYDDYAVRAFEVHALDYIMKPFDDDRFDEALVHARTQLRMESGDSLRHRLNGVVEALQGLGERPASASQVSSIPARWLERLVIRTQDRAWFVRVADIEWVEAADYNVRIHTSDQTYTTRETLSGLAEQLDPRRFVRVHRSTIVNIDRVREIQPYFHGAYILVLQDGTQIRLSRSRRHALEEALGQTL
ncbi:MAG TPA: LytTR family DNA-binding domain-containing protein [Gemmatimonadota bacterium]|nr:LytTR family DNA-binding domain-containing protein [Gemmatimonadota bacterium]